jgi:tetratricopeptide (TPR) repeat protein
MSLLLDARKKSQPAPVAQEALRVQQTSGLNQDSKLSPIDLPHETDPNRARNTGQNLFNAKLPTPEPSFPPPNRNLWLALGGTALLLGIAAAYLWHADSTGNTKPQHPALTQPAAPITQQPVAATGAQQTRLVPGIATQKIAATEPSAPTTKPPNTATVSTTSAFPATARAPAESAPSPASQLRDISPAHQNNPIRIEQRKVDPVDPLLGNAYLAYRSGELDKAQKLYLAMFKKDAQNSDALLGLATIAQQRGESQIAAQYYARVLTMDPRNALANAGMSALSKDDERNESRLKNLLHEQGNSAVLHFALGNLYAGQSRWGEAQQAYFNAYTLESGNAEFAFNLAVSLDHLGQKKLAAQHYQRALTLDQLHTAGFDHTRTSLRIQDLSR